MTAPCSALCRKCGLRAATGVIFDLCDPCLDAFLEKIEREAAASESGKYMPSDAEVEYINEPFFDRSGN